MKEIKIAKYSVYVFGDIAPYDNFRKLYKGVKVCVKNYDGQIDLKIFNKTLKTSLWKRIDESMKCIIFNDESNSITCDFENVPKNKCPHTLTFEKDVYDELKSNIPEFMKECGVNFVDGVVPDGFIMNF